MRSLTIEHDLFFISEKFLGEFVGCLHHALVMPMKDYLANPSYHNVLSASNHNTWRIKADYVVVSKEKWYEALPTDFREKLYEETKRNGSEFIYGNQIITKNYWRNLSDLEKQQVIGDFDDETIALDLSRIDSYEYLKKYHNVFPSNHGPNCFAATMYAVSKDDFFINHWIFADTLLNFLSTNNYRRTDERKSEKDDVICLFEGGKLVHSFYCIDNEYSFNKNGQTMHEPWTIIKAEDVLKEFESAEMVIFKRAQADR